MDAFEQLVSEILWAQGYWIRSSVKVDLTAEDKQEINSPFSPRWEIDVVAYSGSENVIRVVECKSYLDSRGVSYRVLETDPRGRYKLFSNDNLRAVVFNRLKQQLAESGACRANPTVKLCLACGKITSKADQEKLRTYFATKGWELWGPDWLLAGLQGLASQSYENQVSSLVAKLFIRNGWTAPASQPAELTVPAA